MPVGYVPSTNERNPENLARAIRDLASIFTFVPLTQDTSPDITADFLISFDASTNDIRKVLLSALFGGEWTATTFTPTSTVGTFNAGVAGSTRYLQRGKIVFFTILVDMPAGSTGAPGNPAGSIVVTLPVTGKTTIFAPFQGNEYNATGFMCSGVMGALGTTAFIARYDGATIIAADRKVVLSGSYEAA